MKEKTSKRGLGVVGGIALLLLVGLLAANFMGLNPLLTTQAQEERPALLVSVQDLSQYHAAVGNFEVVIDDKNNDISWLPEFASGTRTLFIV